MVAITLSIVIIEYRDWFIKMKIKKWKDLYKWSDLPGFMVTCKATLLLWYAVKQQNFLSPKYDPKLYPHISQLYMYTHTYTK